MGENGFHHVGTGLTVFEQEDPVEGPVVWLDSPAAVMQIVRYVLREFGAAYPGIARLADLTTEDGCALVEHRLADHPVDLLVNNAGVGTVGTFHQLPRQAEADEVRVNVLALLRLTHAGLQSMVAAGRQPTKFGGAPS